jgi:hypothetical protein
MRIETHTTYWPATNALERAFLATNVPLDYEVGEDILILEAPEDRFLRISEAEAYGNDWTGEWGFEEEEQWLLLQFDEELETLSLALDQEA